MKCPKCGNSNKAGQNECSRCGVIFEKYLAFQEKRQKKLHQEKEQQTSKGKLSNILVATVLLVGIGAGGVYVTRNKSTDPVVSVQEESVGQVASKEKQEKSRHISTPRVVKKERASQEPEGLAGQLAQEYPVSNPVEAARNATIAIITPWGGGSGFFIDPHGTIVTNRHVIEYDKKQYEKLATQVKKLDRWLQYEKKNIEITRKQLRTIADQEIRNQVVENIQLRQEQYNQYRHKFERLQEQLEAIEQSDFQRDGKVVLIDGSEYQVDSVEVSENQDLALLSISVYNSPYIASATSRTDQGKTVYTIGSPAGLHPHHYFRDNIRIQAI